MPKITKQKIKLPISEMVGVASEGELNVVEDDRVDKHKMKGGKMIKIDYEGAWKELKENYIIETNFKAGKNAVMDDLEKKYTQNVIELKRRSDKEIADYCLKKHAEVYLENIELKHKLKENRKWKKELYEVYMVCLKKDNKKLVIHEGMGGKRMAKYDDIFKGQEELLYNGEKMKIIELKISYPFIQPQKPLPEADPDDDEIIIKKVN